MKRNKWLKMKKSSFIEGTVIATLAIVITKILGMLYVIPFYAIIGVQGSALYAYAYNIYVIFLDISSAGLPVAISKIIKEYNTLGMMDAKVRAYKVAKKIISFISVAAFIVLFLFAGNLASLILGDLQGGNTISDVTFVIRCVSFAILVIPFLSVSKGYLQGHNIINVSSISQVIEQVVRIIVILGGSYLGLKVLNLSLTTSVGIAVFGAFAGGFAAMLYIFINMRKNKKELSLEEVEKKDDISNREILKKIISYAIPFIIIDVAVSLYNFIDMVLISRTMGYLGYDAATTEFVTSSVATWANKINVIVNSVAMGLTVSLIPNIVEAFTLKKWSLVEKRLNKAIQIILVTCIPMVLGISFLAKPIWNIFYGNSNLELGSIVLGVSIFGALFYNIYMITSMTLQSLNKFKAVYFTTFLGYLTNAFLDVPLMLLCHRLNLQPFIGALLATILGYTLASTSALIILRKHHQLKYHESYKMFGKILVPSLCMMLVVFLVARLCPISYNSRTSCIFYVFLTSVSGAIVYLFIAYKMKILDNVFGKEYLDRIIRKLTFNKWPKKNTKN
uniref:putative polysaccharide biosynthesis protein n=1 Tax=Candidatus Ventrenecus sp. TaxID=3085654 RepID=UPI004024AD9B